jgi:general secretion pathway protein K
MARVRAHERGAALLIVMVAVAVLTALATDLAYETRLSLRIAANARDDLRATSLAKGGVALSRLVLGFQQQIDGSLGAVKVPNMASVPRPQLWRLVPVSSALATGLFGGAGAALPAEGARDGERASSGPPPAGDFEVRLDDEARKVNVQLDTSGELLASQVQALYQLVCDPKWDALFDREDENGMRVSRQELLVYLRDWVDDLSEASALTPSFPPGSCLMVMPPAGPFERGFQDENFPYDRGEDRYRTKNARLDSLAELHLVAGVTDAFMAAFGDALTVYLPRDAKPNVNETDPLALLRRASAIADAQDDAALLDLEFVARLHRSVLEKSSGGLLAYSTTDFGRFVEDAGLKVNPNKVNPSSNSNPFVDRSTVFRIQSVGRAGDVTKRIDAVVWLVDAKTNPNAPAATPVPGKLVHWREE